MRKSFPALIGIFVLVLMGAHPVRAQMRLLVSPPRVELRLGAGAAETNVIVVRNEGARAARVKVYLEDWTLTPTGGINYLRAGKDPRSCAAWLQVNPRDFRLEPGLSRQVRYTLTVPPGAKEGGYHTAILFEFMPAVAGLVLGEKRMGAHGRIATIVYETVGKPEIKAQLQDFQVSLEKKGLVFKLVLANQGEGHFRLKGSKIMVKNSQGREAALVKIPDIPVLPKSSRELEIKEDLTLPPGEYRAEAVVDVGRRELLGRKKAFVISP